MSTVFLVKGCKGPKPAHLPGTDFQAELMNGAAPPDAEMAATTTTTTTAIIIIIIIFIVPSKRG